MSHIENEPNEEIFEPEEHVTQNSSVHSPLASMMNNQTISSERNSLEIEQALPVGGESDLQTNPSWSKNLTDRLNLECSESY